MEAKHRSSRNLITYAPKTIDNHALYIPHHLFPSYIYFQEQFVCCFISFSFTSFSFFLEQVEGRLTRWRSELTDRTRVGEGLAGQRRPAIITKTNCKEFLGQGKHFMKTYIDVFEKRKIFFYYFVFKFLTLMFVETVDSLKPHGRVVDLAFMEDKRLAEVVCWAFLSKMSAVVVDTREQTEACFKLGAK